MRIPFLVKFGPKNLNFLFQMKFSTKNISNKLNTMVMFASSALDQKYPCWENLVPILKIAQDEIQIHED